MSVRGLRPLAIGLFYVLWASLTITTASLLFGALGELSAQTCTSVQPFSIHSVQVAMTLGITVLYAHAAHMSITFGRFAAPYIKKWVLAGNTVTSVHPTPIAP
jgi:hypothetical protein